MKLFLEESVPIHFCKIFLLPEHQDGYYVEASLMIKTHAEVGKCRRFYYVGLMIDLQHSGFGDGVDCEKASHQIRISRFGDVYKEGRIRQISFRMT
jgi:hypothetical protein